MHAENKNSNLGMNTLHEDAPLGNSPTAPLNPNNMLVLNLGQLGDVVLSLPALAAIRGRFPRAQITVAAGIAAGQIVELSGLADRVFPVDRVALRDGPKLRSIARILRFLWEVRRNRFDLLIDLRSFWETNLLGYLSGAPARLFANRGHRSLDLLATIRAPREDPRTHLVDRYLDVLKPLGIDGAPRIPRLPTRKEDDEAAARMLQHWNATDGRPLIGFFPGAGNPSRRWPLSRFAEVASRLERNERARILLLLGPEEQVMAQQARSTFPATTMVLDHHFPTLSQLASIADRLTLLVSNDTGPAHVAAAVGTPVVVIVGSLFPENLSYAPVGHHHHIVSHPSITQIGVDEVYDAARSSLSASAARSV